MHQSNCEKRSCEHYKHWAVATHPLSKLARPAKNCGQKLASLPLIRGWNPSKEGKGPKQADEGKLHQVADTATCDKLVLGLHSCGRRQMYVGWGVQPKPNDEGSYMPRIWFLRQANWEASIRMKPPPAFQMHVKSHATTDTVPSNTVRSVAGRCTAPLRVEVVQQSERPKET